MGSVDEGGEDPVLVKGSGSGVVVREVFVGSGVVGRVVVLSGLAVVVTGSCVWAGPVEADSAGSGVVGEGGELVDGSVGSARTPISTMPSHWR
jgi:hypothetical protein